MDITKISKEQLESLSPEERKLALEILEQYAKKGSSEIFNELVYSDYEEIPVDIETFLTDDSYMGQAWKDSENKLKIYPYWMKKLKELFPTPFDTKVNNFIASGARGLGKSEICVAIMCYLLYRIMCLKNPLEYFHMKPTEKIVFAFMNIKLDLAEEIANSKFQNSIKMSPWFLKRGSVTGRYQKYWEPNPEYCVDIKIGSQSDDLIGLPCYAIFFDEISFIRNQNIDIQKQKAIDMIDTAIGGMMTRFIHNGKNPTLLMLASSKRSEKSFLEEHIKTKLASEPENVMIVDEPVWIVKPKGTYSDKTFPLAVGNKFLVSQVLKEDEDVSEYIQKGYRIIYPPIDLRAQFLDDMDRALCDFAGISSTQLSKYISGEAVKDCINKELQNPFAKEIIEVGNGKDDKLEYKDFFDISKVPLDMKNKPLYVHLDMSISGDMTGISGVWIKGKKPSSNEKNQSKDLFFQLAFSVSVKAPKGRQISFEKNRNFIRWLREQEFNVREVSTDTFQSYDLRQQLESEGFVCSVQSVDRVEPNSHVCVPYQFLKNVIYEQRVAMFEDNSLIEELVNLERDITTGKIDHPASFRKDAADSFCGSLFTASKYAEEYAYNYGEDYDAFLGANETEELKGEEKKKQLLVDFEEQLKQFGISNKPPEQPPEQKKKETENKNPFIMNDILIW